MVHEGGEAGGGGGGGGGGGVGGGVLIGASSCCLKVIKRKGAGKRGNFRKGGSVIPLGRGRRLDHEKESQKLLRRTKRKKEYLRKIWRITVKSGRLAPKQIRIERDKEVGERREREKI